MYLTKRKDLFLGYFFFSVLNSLSTSIIFVRLLDFISDSVSGKNDVGAKGIIGLSILYTLSQIIIFGGYFWFKNKFLQNVVQLIRCDYFNSVMQKKPVDFLSKSISSYSVTMSKQMEEVKKYYIKMFALMIDLIALITVMVYSFLSNRMITILTFLFSIFIAIIPLLLQKKVAHNNIEFHKEWEKFNTYTEGQISCYDVSRIYQKLRYIKKNFQKMNTSIAAKEFKVDLLSSYIQVLMMISVDAMRLLMMGACAVYILKGDLPASYLIVITVITEKISAGINDIIIDLTEFRTAKPIFDNIMKTIKGSEKNNDDNNTEMNSFESIEFKNVRFSYEGILNVLNKVNLQIKPKDVVVITGESGSGKSTITKLLLGYYKINDGLILYNDKKINLNSSGYLKKFSVVFQNTPIIEDTLYNNVTLYQNYKESDVLKALEKAGLSKLVLSLPEGANTIIRENGKNLSGGERQRIAIARAILMNREIIIMDEATSSLDEKTAKEIEKDILNLDDVTIIMITHHMHKEVMERCTKHYVINNGNLILDINDKKAIS